MTNKSGSQMVLEYLQTLEDGQEFSRHSIAAALPSVGEGAISGFLSKLKAQGKIILSSRSPSVNGQKPLEHYSIPDAIELENTPTRSAGAVGGKIGRTTKGVTNRQRVCDLLYSVIEDIEKMQVGLSDYTTKELLKEIERRTIAAESYDHPEDAARA